MKPAENERAGSTLSVCCRQGVLSYFIMKPTMA